MSRFKYVRVQNIRKFGYYDKVLNMRLDAVMERF